MNREDLYREIKKKEEIDLKNKRLNPKELNNLLFKLKREYGVYSPFTLVPSSDEALARPQRAAEQWGDVTEKIFKDKALAQEAREKLLGFQAPPLKSVILHEAGHAADLQFSVGRGLSRKGLRAAGYLATTAGIPLAVLAAGRNHDTLTEPLLAGGTTLGAGVASSIAGNVLENIDEDRANEFVKRFMAEELGSRQAAEEWFEQTTLPLARKTYDVGLMNDAKKTAKRGLSVGLTSLAGLAIANKINEHRNQKTTQ